MQHQITGANGKSYSFMNSKDEHQVILAPAGAGNGTNLDLDDLAALGTIGQEPLDILDLFATANYKLIHIIAFYRHHQGFYMSPHKGCLTRDCRFDLARQS